MLEDCATTQYSNDTPLKSIIKTDTDSVNPPESSDTGTSLLHQALKRKRTESETENLYKRQFFITATNTAVVSSASHPKPTSSLLTSALTSPPKAMRHSGTRPIFHLIPNRNLKSTHVELLNLLKQNSSLPANKTETSKATVTTSQPALVTTAAAESNPQN